MNNLSQSISSSLLRLKAVKMQPNNPFAWSKGMQAPIYFDSRKLFSFPKERTLLKQEMAQLIKEQYPEVEAIAAVATNSIALGILVADYLGLPFVYVRSNPKEHGLENLIEGSLKPHQKVVIIEDQVSMGVNCTRVKDILQKDGSQVIGMVTILHFQLEDAIINLRNAQLECHALTTLEDVIAEAIQAKLLTQEGKKIMENWQQTPNTWKK